jgi:hypothetical protein
MSSATPTHVLMPPAPPSDLEKPAIDPSTRLSVAEATRRLGVGRARVYQLIEAGALDTVSTRPVRITLDSVERRRNTSSAAGAPLASLSAWAVLALGSGDAAFLKQVAGLPSDPDRSRARSRLQQHGLLELLPRLRTRAAERRFLVGAEPLLELLADPRVLLAGTSAAQVPGWDLPSGTWPVEAYVAETHLVALIEKFGLERDDQSAELVLRGVQEPWPFAPHARVAPAVVAACDLAESAEARLVELGTGRLAELTRDAVADWLQRPPRRRPVRPVITTGCAGACACAWAKTGRGRSGLGRPGRAGCDAAGRAAVRGGHSAAANSGDRYSESQSGETGAGLRGAAGRPTSRTAPAGSR